MYIGAAAGSDFVIQKEISLPRDEVSKNITNARLQQRHGFE